MENKSRKKITLVNVVVFLVQTITLSLLSMFFVVASVYAAGGGEGGGTSGGGVPCVKNGKLVGTLCTRYGARWQYYTTSSNDVYISGKSGNPPYAHDGHITGCAAAGGYWRYAMVAFAGSEKGQQVGLTSIGGTYKSEHFGGIMNDLSPSAWSTAESLYSRLRAQDPSTFWRGWNSDSSLEWFCAGVPETPSPTPGPNPGGGGGGGPECSDSDPKSFNSFSDSGNLSVNVGVRNDRTLTYSSDKIYARPGDRVVWSNTYYATTPALGGREVSTINGDKVGEYDDLSDMYCQPSGGFCSGYVPITNKRIDGKVSPWENQFSIYLERLDENNYLSTRLDKRTYNYGRSQNVYNDIKDFDRVVSATEDVGQTLKEEARAGTYYDDGYRTGVPSYINVQTASPQPRRTATNVYYTYEWDHDDCLIARMVDVGGQLEEYEFIIPCDSVMSTDTQIESVAIYTDKRHEKSCVNSYDDVFVEASVEQEEKTDEASVEVPYNYNNYTGVVINSPYIYAGETVTVDKIMMDVGPKYNGATQDTYATKVPYATTRLFAYASDSSNGRGATSNYTISRSSDGCAMIGGAAKDGQCVEMPSLHTIYPLNSAGNLGLYEDYYNSLSYEDKRWANRYDYENNYRVYSDYLGKRTYNAFDIAAGDYMCFVAAIYPASSGSDYQTGIQGDEQWRYSEPKCVVIAKRPTFQVWGGDVYSVNNIKATPAAKNNIYMDYTWPSGTFNSTRFNTERRNTTYFGSWSEQGITIRDGVTGTVASGAATGYARPNYVVKAGNTGTFCNERVPLTFANYPCILGEVGMSAIPSGVSDNREDLLKYWLGNNLGETVEKIKNSERNNWTEITTDGGSRVEYIHVGADYTIRDNIIAKGSTRLLISDGSINIIENLRIPSGLTNSKEIPKLIILADNINIRCTVDEIDAILITRKNGTVNTCINATKDNDNDVKRSNQLKIFGTVITDMLVLGRTYGGGATEKLEATSDDAETRAVPNEDRAAEIFDFDPTILLWGEAKSSTAETSTLQETHQRELAPRY